MSPQLSWSFVYSFNRLYNFLLKDHTHLLDLFLHYYTLCYYKFSCLLTYPFSLLLVIRDINNY